MANANDIRWFQSTFGGEIGSALEGTPFDVGMLTALACQETGELWTTIRHKGLSAAQVAALCNGDTFDDTSSSPRRAFPRNKAELLSEPNGDRMYDIARKALIDMAGHVPGYRRVAGNPNKFCHGYGVFQRDLQFFKVDPDYFLERRYERFEGTLAHCLGELRKGLKKLDYEDRDRLTDLEFAKVGIVYNTGGYKKHRGLKQGHYSGGKYYGEHLYDYLRLVRSVGGSGVAARPGRFRVNVRHGLNLRKGPGTAYGITETLAPGTVVTVLGYDGPGGDWARVDLEGDGRVDGHVHAGYLKLSGEDVSPEAVPEPA